MHPIALVTGGGGGLGAAICELAGRKGYLVVVADQHLDTARAVAANIPGARPEALDVTREAEVEALLDRLEAAPALVVNNAGIGRFGPLMDMPLEQFESVLRVNLLSCFIVGRACARRMAPRGSGSNSCRRHPPQARRGPTLGPIPLVPAAVPLQLAPTQLAPSLALQVLQAVQHRCRRSRGHLQSLERIAAVILRHGHGHGHGHDHRMGACCMRAFLAASQECIQRIGVVRLSRHQAC